jgi:cytochrome c peroxidase
MKASIAGIITSLIIIALTWAFKVKPQQPMEYYRPYVLQELKLTTDELVKIRSNPANLRGMQKAYHESRKHYKHIECFIEYCSPKESKYVINGPLVPKNDPEFGHKVFYPNGFQTIEESLFSGDPIDTLLLTKRINDLVNQLDLLRLYYQTLQIEPGELLEIFQYELYRIASLYLNGYDATYTLTNITEIKYSLDGLQDV